MKRHHQLGWFLLSGFLFVACALAPASQAGFTDALKKRVDQATKGARQTADKVAGKAPASATENPAPPSADTEAAQPAAEPGSASTKVSQVSTKFDFVPGDSVMFDDDFRSDELGEFPARWRLVLGTFEVADFESERWLRCVSADGRVRMKMPVGPLPEFWTLEFDFYCADLGGGMALTVSALAKGDQTVWEAMFPYSGNSLAFRCGDIFSGTPLEGGAIAGRHHIMLLGRGTAVKAYIDRQRLANVPDVSAGGTPIDFEFRLWAPTKPMIANVRFAAGCRPPKDQLAEGKLVTHGIRFATGSDVVLPESAPVLRQVAAYLEANPAVRLRITGHTDNVGVSAANLDLSKRRAASVAGVLAEQFAIAASRFATDGRGDTQPLSSNAKTEGRAMNRRVEFAKL